jgi:DNA polymerase III subunit epsilon
MPHSPYIEAFTGISNEMVAARRALPTSPRWCSRSCAAPVFVAHNARFDYSFLRSEFRRLGVQLSPPRCCARSSCRGACFPSSTATASMR